MDDHITYMRLALTEAKKSPPKPTNFCVGAVLVSSSATDPDQEIVTTGYTLELPGNTHAEQNCFAKALSSAPHIPSNSVLYTTMEPCNKRSVGNKPCVDRILELKDVEGEQAVKMVVVGVLEPGTFVGVNEGRARLEGAGIGIVQVEGEGCEELRKEILRVATAGHVKDGEKEESGG